MGVNIDGIDPARVEGGRARRTSPWTSYPLLNRSSARYDPSWPVIPVMKAFFVMVNRFVPTIKSGIISRYWSTGGREPGLTPLLVIPHRGVIALCDPRWIDPEEKIKNAAILLARNPWQHLPELSGVVFKLHFLWSTISSILIFLLSFSPLLPGLMRAW